MANNQGFFGIINSLYEMWSNTFGTRDAFAKALPDVEDRGVRGRLERLPTLEAEGRDDFLTGFRNWRGGTVQRKAKERFDNLARAAGFDPKQKMELAKIHEIVESDHIIGTEGLLRIIPQRFAHKNFYNSFADQHERYLAEMQSYDTLGPGSLELNPDLVIPSYAKHEIHMQPGGYVGNEFAGHLYHYGTNAFYSARARNNYQDQYHARLGAKVSIPEDNKVARILDVGCGIGQFAVALKERFPDTEVWGIDVAAPMLRYGHMRAVDENIAVNFSQRLAENTGFPDKHFDIVASYIVHHEVPAEVSRAIFREAHRILRPGGIYYPIDFYSGGRRGVPGAFSQYQEWKDHRWNNERWRLEYASMAFASDLEDVGFIVNNEQSPNWSKNRNIFGVKSL